MAEASYTSKIKFSVDDLMSSLAACKTQAEQVDGVLANIGKRGNLNNFIRQFIAMDDAVKALRKDLDSVKAGLGDKLNNGWMKSFDEMVKKMSQISELSKIVFEGLSGVNLKDKGATKELRSYAEQLNTILNNVGIDKQIDLELFDKKDIEAQYNELIQFAAELNGKLSVVFGEIDLSKIGEKIKSAGGKVKYDIKTTGSEISAEVQAQIDELKKQKAAYQEILDIFNGKGKRLKTTKENDKIALVGLVEDYKKAKEELAELERTGKPGKEEALIKKIKAASMLKETRDYVFEHGSPAAAAYAANESAETSEDAEKFLEDIRTKQNATLDKMKSDCRQKIQEINTEIAKLGKEVPKTKNEPKNATISYEKLTQSVERYYELQRKLDTAADSNEFNKIADEADKIADSFSNMDSACSVVFDRIQDGLGKSEALSQLADILNVQPSGIEAGVKAAQEAADSAKKKADEEERAYQAITKSVEAQRVMYHLGTGSAINGKGTRSDTFADMLDNLTTNANGTRYEKYGYGVLGSGLFGVQNPSTIPEEQAASAGKFIYSLDLSKYNMYLLDTEERAANLMDFMSKLQKIAIRGAVPDYTGFNEFLGNTDLNSLYEQFKTLFDETKFTKEQLGSFIDEMVSQLTQAGLFFDSEKGQLDFRNISDELANSDNISTRFFKKLGYQGVNVGNTSLDGFGQGSVLFDFNQSDIVGYFNTIEQAAQDFQNNLKSGWVGSNEQLQQYLANIEEIIAKISTAKQNKLQLMPNFDTSDYDNTLALLNNVKQNISNILSNNATESASSSFAIVTDNQTAQLEKEKQLMQEIAALKEKLNAVPTNPVDASELESAQKQVKELEEEILRMEGALDSWKSSYYEIQQSLDYSIPMSEVENMTSNDVVYEYRAQIESLSSTIDELKAKLAEAKEQLNGFGQDTGLYSADNLQLSLWPMTDEEIAAKEKLAATNEKVAESQNKINQAKQLEGQMSFDDLSVAEESKASGGQAVEGASAISSEADDANKAKEAFAAAAEQKQKFIDANAKVKESAEASAAAIEKEIEKAREASESFASATQAKNDFANANQNVKDSADKTAESLGNEAAASKGTRKRKTSQASSSESSNDGYKDSDTYKTLIDADKKLSSAFNKIDTEVFVDKNTELGQLKTRYEELTKEIQELTRSEETLGKVSEEDMQRLSTETKQLMSDFEKYAQAKKEASKQKDSTYGADVLEKVQSQHTSLIDKVDSGGYSNASGIVDKLQQYEQAYQRILDLQKKLADIDITSDLGKKTAAEFDDEVKSFNNYGKEIENIIKKSENLQNKIGNIHRAVSEGFDLGDEASRRSELEAFANSFDGLDKKSIQFADSYSKVVFTIKNGNGEIEKITASFNQAGTAIDASSKNLGKAVNKFTSFFDGVKKKTGEIATYFTGANLVYQTVAKIRQGITYVREIDAALTELKKVTDETDETYKRFLQDASKTAGQIGSTVKDFTNATADFARLGYNIEQASGLAKAASVYYNVGDDLANIGEASDSIISTMHGFGIEAENAMNIVDKFNEVGNNFAISSSGIGQALLRSASAMAEAGNTIDESIGLITAANSVVQNPETVGTAMKTLSLRIRGAKVELEDAGEDVDGMASSVSELQKKLLALTGGKVNIMLDDNTFKNTTEILREMSAVWDDMTDVNRASALELLGGKRQANVLAAVIKNFDMVEDVIKTSSDAAGSAEAENEKYLNSIQGKIDQFTNAVQTMWMNFINADIVKFIVSVGTAIVQLVDKIGMIPTALTAIVAFKGFSVLIKNFKDIQAAISLIVSESTRTGKTVFEVASQVDLLSLKAKLASSALIKFAVDNGVAQASEVATMTTTQLLGVAFQGLILKLKKAGKAMLAFIKVNPWVAVVAGVALAITSISLLVKTHKDYVNELKETSDEISDVKNNIQSLNDELKTTQDRIDELNKKDKLSFADEEELKNLKAQNAELERSIRLAEQKEKRLQKEASKSLNKAVESDTLFSNTTWTKYVNSKGEQVSAAEAFQYADGIYELKEGYTEETVTGTNLQKKIEQYKFAQELLKRAKDELEKLGDDAKDKEVESAEAKVERMQRNMDAAYDAISDTMDKINEDYLSQEGVEWQYGNPDELEDWQKQMNANLKIIYDAQDKLAIASDTTGKAIESAFSRVSFQTEFQDELKTIQETVGITGEKLKDMYDSSNDTSDTGIKAFIQSLIDCGVIANTSADELQKVVDLSLQLGGNTSRAAVANRKLARSQKMLQYYKQYKELNQYTQKLRDATNGANSLTTEEKKQISIIRTKMQALASEISAYDILGDQINEAKAAFEEFENAKTADGDSDYLSTAGEMLQTVIKGYQSAEIGSDAFKSAFKSLIPESVYKDLDTLEERYTAAAEYISGALSRYFKIEYDDDGAIESVETTTKHIETFIEDAKEKGLMSFSDGVWTVNETDFKNFADKMGITESMLVAIGEQIDKIDADWIMGDNSSFFDSFDMGTEANIYKTIKALADLDQQYIDTVNNEKLTEEERKKALDDYVINYKAYQEQLTQNSNDAISDIEAYSAATKSVDECTAKVNDAKQKLQELKDSGADESEIAIAEGNLDTVIRELAEAVAKKGQLTQPSEMVIQFAQEAIDSQMTAIKEKWEKDHVDLPVILEDGKVNSELLELGEDGKYTVKLTPKVEALSDEDKATLSSYANLINQQNTLKEYNQDAENAKQKSDELKKTYEDLSQVIEDLPDPDIDTSQAQTNVNTLKSSVEKLKKALDDVDDKEVTTTVTTVNKTVYETENKSGGLFGWLFGGSTSLNGTANAQGSWGAEKTSTSLVGELGPELRVRGNHWDMLGKNGAEFADVKKGDIIFNHKQTKSLLKNGYINSRGKAYAGGNTQSGGIFSDIRQLIIEIKKIIDKIKIDKLADKYNELVNGNVDYNKRPFVSPEYMRQSGWYEFDGDVATTYDVDYHVSDLTGKEYMIKVTPILDNGEVLSPQELDEYVDNVLNGTNDILSADKDNLVINIAPYVSDDQFAQLDEQLGNIKGPHWDLVQQYADLNNESPYTVDINPSIDQDSLTQTEAELDNISRDRYVNIYTKTVKTDTSTPFSWPMHIGSAYSSGSRGLKQNETNALVGELGPETLVRNGKYQTIGENGAEMMNLKRGDIIFNHQQTEALLKHGYVNSRGKSFATGNAHVGTSGTIFTKYATISGYGGTVPDWFGNSNILGDLSSAAGSVSSASDAAEDAADDAKQAIDFIEYRLEEIENSITNMANKVENFLDDTSQTKEKNSLYEGLVDAEKQKASTYLAAAEIYNEKAAQLLSEVPAEYQEMAKNGAIAIKKFIGENEGEIADAIEEYRTWSSKAEDAENNYLASIAEISAKRLEQLQDIADDFENIVGLTEQHTNLIQGEMDLLDEAGERLSENFYKELMKDSKKQIEDLNNKRASLQDILDNAVKSGDVKVGSDDWYEMVNAIFDVDDAILECKKDIEGFQNSINDLYWDNLDKLIDRIDNVDSELSHLYNLVSDEEKVVDDAGNWTKDGVTALGLLAQQLEVANFKVEQYGEAIAHLEKDYAAGLYSTDEYNEKLAELKENQWDAIEAQESAKKSIIDLNKTRIQAVKDGMQKEIDAYSELIDKKKEELNLQKESHDFSKQVAEQQKNIADIEKRLAVISGDNSASAIAQKKKLQAELAQAKEELEELYYDHSVEKQQDALDKQLEDYQNNKQDEMDALDESLKNENQVIQDSYAVIAANTDSLAQNLSEIADKYGITLSDSVTKPWLEGVDAIGTYQEQLDTSASAFTEQLRALKQELVDLQVEADKTADSIIKATNSKKNSTESAKYTPPTPSTPQQSPSPAPATPEPPSKGSSVTVKSSATNFSRNGGNGTRMQSWVPGSTFTVYQVSGDDVLLGRNGGYTGWVNLSDIEGYAKGSKAISKDQFAFLDELGEELQLVPDGAGRLSYVKKGTGIIPADLTERLMEWGKLDPSSVLEQSRPVVSAPHVINNNLELNLQVGEVVHIDRADNSSIPNITKAVQDQMDNYMKNINKKLYNRVR